MKLLFPVLLFIAVSCSAAAQVNYPIAGKWKVVAINNGVIYDYKTKKTSVTGELTQTLVGRTDSAEIVERFAKLAKRYEDYYIIFGKDGSYKEVMSGEVRGDTAVYWLMEEEHVVYMRRASDEDQVIQSMMYDIQKDGMLELIITFMDRKMRMTLEKSE
jgi:hypothetical protein